MSSDLQRPREESRPVAVVYCQDRFATTYGKTAHGLVRRSERYRIGAVIDRQLAGQDAGQVLDGEAAGIPIVADLDEAIAVLERRETPATTFVIGLAPDGGRLSSEDRAVVHAALERGLDVHSGLHDWLSDDPELVAVAEASGAEIVDVRKPPARELLHAFTGKIEEVRSLKVAVLGTDSAVGKRTTAWLLVDALREHGYRAELVGTGQTAWLQGARFSIPLDSLINDFLAGEIEHAVWSAWNETRPQVIVIEGQGSLMNPAYPGGYEILAAGRPDVVVLQHAPAREEYDGFPGYPLHPPAVQIQAIELISGRSVVAVTLNQEKLDEEGIERARAELADRLGLPVIAPLREGCGGLAELLAPRIPSVDDRS